MDVDDVDINENGLFIKYTEKYENRVDFLNQYFAFQFNKKVVKYHIKRKHQIESLSNDDLSVISNISPPELYKLEGYDDLNYAKKRIIDCHNKLFNDRNVLMPFVTFVNYHKNGQSFKTSDENISISGKFKGEVFAKYNEDDVLRLGSGYDFITDTKYIYSIPLTYQMANGKKLIINRNPLDAVDLGNGRWKPLIKHQPNAVIVSWFPLYLENAPMYPAMIAKIIADEVNLPAENILHNIIKLNLHALVPAAIQLRESDNAYARFLGSLAQRQLETIAELR